MLGLILDRLLDARDHSRGHEPRGPNDVLAAHGQFLHDELTGFRRDLELAPVLVGDEYVLGGLTVAEIDHDAD